MHGVLSIFLERVFHRRFLPFELRIGNVKEDGFASGSDVPVVHSAAIALSVSYMIEKLLGEKAKLKPDLVR